MLLSAAADLTAFERVIDSIFQLSRRHYRAWAKTSAEVFISHDDMVKKVGGIYEEFRKKQDAEYVSEFDRETAKYLKGGEPE